MIVTIHRGQQPSTKGGHQLQKPPYKGQLLFLLHLSVCDVSWPENPFGMKKKCGPETISGPKTCRSENSFVTKKFWVRKKFGSEKNGESERILGTNFFVVLVFFCDMDP